jgi:predicted ATP-grasp superfamily ATP-dependent carboligase
MSDQPSAPHQSLGEADAGPAVQRSPRHLYGTRPGLTGADGCLVRFVPDRPAVVLGQLHAALAIERALGRRGVPVHGMAFHHSDFGLSSRYLRSRHMVVEEPLEARDALALQILRRIARTDTSGTGGRAAGRIVLIPERDDHVAFVLRNQAELAGFADFPLPPDPDVTCSLRRKERLVEVAAAAGVPAPATVHAHDEQAIRTSGLRAPFLLKPVEGQDFALHFGEKVMVAQTMDEAVEKWRLATDAGFETLVQEFIPDSSDRIWSLLTYISTDGRPLGCVVGRKIRQGPLKFGTSAYFAVDHDDRVLDFGLRLLLHAGYRGIAHVEMAHDARDDTFKLLEVNTRPPVWFGLAVNDRFDMACLAYADLTGQVPVSCRLFKDDLAWAYLAKDVYVTYQMARNGEVKLGDVLRDYRKPKVRAVFALDDPRPGLSSLRYLASRR